MCGILGFNWDDEKLAEKAVLTFKYRGPDATKIYSDKNLTFAHNRLSIIDTDSRSDQPLFIENGDIGIIFNGEIYNFKEIKSKLQTKYKFKTTSDTEVILYAYKEYGTELTKYIQGMYAFAIYDKIKHKILIFRDHVGIKPLYYYMKNDFFIFSSEIKGVVKILKEKDIALEFSSKNISKYLIMGYISSPNTVYSNIHKLDKNTYAEFDLVTNNFKINISKQNTKSVKDFKEFQNLIENQVLKHTIADVPVGVFFSGGTDSSLIASILHNKGVNLETFSIEMNHKEEDKKYFNKIKNYLELKSNIYHFGETEFDQIYTEIMNKIDEPSYDASIFPTYYISKKASEKVKVVLSGEGGDEFFYGYTRHPVLYKNKLQLPNKTSLIDNIYFNTPRFKYKDFVFKKLASIFNEAHTFYLLDTSISKDLIKWDKLKNELKKDKITPLKLDKELYLDGDLLRKTDFATSYNSIEGRVPLLDPNIIESSNNFEDMHLKNGILKYSLKKILTKYLPEELVFREKSGFSMNLKKTFKTSKFLSKDLDLAVSYIKRKNIIRNFNIAKISKNKNYYITEYPYFCYALISLYYSIKNLETI